VHKCYVDALVAEEEAALRQAVNAGEILRVERRGTLLVAELEHAVYPMGPGGVPILGQRRTVPIVVALRCDNYDTDPPSLAFVTDWTATVELRWASWPKGAGLVDRHYKTGKPFLCRPGVREFHSHFQHGDEPWDRFRGRVRPRDLLMTLARDLLTKQVF
jgi:hypothetical protein